MAIRIILSVAVALAAWSTAAPAGDAVQSKSQRLPEQVVIDRVLDGDTVVVRGWDQHVRLASIDAPELSHGYGKPGQPFSVAARNWLEKLVVGASDVSIRCVDEDQYRRPVCDLYLQSSHVNRELVELGLAWANTARPQYLRDPSLLQVQQAAKARRLGLWSQDHPIEPWKWRAECWKQQLCARQD